MKTEAMPAAERLSPEREALVWWRIYGDPERGDPGTRARLRRCRSAAQAAEERAAVDLAGRLGALARDPRPNDVPVDVALNLARVLAHVTTHDAVRRPMRAAGWRKFHAATRESDAGSDRPKLGEVRFRRLLATEPGEPQVAAFVRLVTLLDREVNVSQIARDFVEWASSDATVRERVRRRWAFEYFVPPNDSHPHVAPTQTPDEDDAE